ncbi:hypothetical protein FLT15_17845 [Paenibacillus thiaminolyticus]|uniref:hypothetical protein n=1 Tax=Paenibacillus thiaminolyticus TaxID=49283 RepID=UPI0011623CFE|nr:hypothetical protein [Paenibacillus thiaminolyticus]NGP60120.1 hypothetical protein [Paenibacillus thiaminolyticus]
MITERTERFLQKYGLETWGTYNQPPLPLVEIDATEMGSFWTMFSMYGVREIEFRQMQLGEKYVENAHILIYHDRILVVKTTRKKEGDTWHDIPTVYRAGCIHEYDSEILNSRSGDCRNTCRKCGYSYKYNCGD